MNSFPNIEIVVTFYPFNTKLYTLNILYFLLLLSSNDKILLTYLHGVDYNCSLLLSTYIKKLYMAEQKEEKENASFLPYLPHASSY